MMSSAQQPIDPRLEAASSDDAAAQYRRQQQPAPYPAPVPRPDANQIKLYREGDQVQAQPYYYALQAGRSPSDDMGDRRESVGGGDMVDMSPNGQAGHDAKRSRACEACRGLKVRCDMDKADQPCKRCAKAGRQCVVTQPSRRRQKKADTRVAELEKKIDALTAVIQAQQYQHDPRQLPMDVAHDPRQLPLDVAHDDYEEQERRKRRRLDDSQSQSHESDKLKGPFNQHPMQLYADYAQYVKQRVRAIVDWNTACTVFDHFRDNLSVQFPAVVLPADATAESTFETKPMLFLCIVAAACVKFVSPELQDALTDEVFDVFATAVVRKGIKSLEVIQGLQVAFLWHKPPNRPAQANFYMLIHMATVMALDIGLGKPFNPAKSKRGFGGPGSDLPPGPPSAIVVDSDTIEARRTWLCCYYTSASVAQVLRRPTLVRWSNYMQECVDMLETSPDAAPTDRLFAQHLKLQHICEDISVSFAMEDPSATSISILDPKVAYTLNVLEEKLNKWDQNLPHDLRLPTLMFFKHVTTLYLHEISIHVNHNTDDFRVPFTEASLKSGNQYSQTLTHKQMASIEVCLSATHNIIGTFCDLGSDAIRVLPGLLYFVRLVYALVVLIKMHVAATSPGSELGKVLKPQDIKFSESLDRIFRCFKDLSSIGKTARVYTKGLHILGVLRDWVASHPNGDFTAGQSNKDASTRVPPPQRLPPRDNDSLRVLSEAATAGADQAQQRANWSFDSPYGSYAGPRNPDSSSDTYNPLNYPSTVMSTPNSLHNPALSSNDASSYPNMFDPSLTKQNGNAGPEWTSGLDFEQAIDVALSNIDYSGDMFGSFFGDGADAYQIPPDAAMGRW